MGISVGKSLTIEPTLGTFNDAAFDIIDYALFCAREYGLRVIIPFTDNYDYYHGGKVRDISAIFSQLPCVFGQGMRS